MKHAVLRYLLGLFVSCAAAVSAGEEPWYVTKFGEKLVSSSGAEAPVRNVLEGKTVGVYIAASWNASCRYHTPKLERFYRSVARKYDFTVVFVSSDRSRDEMIDHMNEKNRSMPWYAVPFDSPRREELLKDFRGNVLPRLIVFDKDGKVLSRSAIWDVAVLGERAVLRWRSSNYKPLTGSDYLKKYDKKHSKKSSKKHSR